MRVFIAVLVLIFSLQSWTKADDIRDLEIEGVSIGDSLLDYYSEEEIKNNSQTFWLLSSFKATAPSNASQQGLQHGAWQPEDTLGIGPLR